MKTDVHLWQYLAEFFLEWEVFPAQMMGENQSTHFLLNNFFPKIVRFMR